MGYPKPAGLELAAETLKHYVDEVKITTNNADKAAPCG